MKKISTILVLVLASLVLFASCEQPSPDIKPEQKPVEMEKRSIVEVGLSITETKSLSSDINRDIKSWEFMATPKFTLDAEAGEMIYGTVSYWRPLKALDTGSDNVVKTAAQLGRYTSGDWLFEVRALNANKHVVAVGSKQQVLREGIDNTVEINMLTDRADGTHGESADRASSITGREPNSPGADTTVQYGSMKVGILINQLDEVPGNIRIETISQKVNKDLSGDMFTQPKTETLNWTSVQPGGKLTNWWVDGTALDNGQAGESATETVPAGKIYYEAELKNMDAGPYVFTFKIIGKDKQNQDIVLGGQTVDVMIVGGEQTLVKGSLLANEYVMSGLKLRAPGTIFGSINGKKFIIGDPQIPILLEWHQSTEEQQDSGEEASKYIWYVNEKQVTTTAGSDPFSFQCPTTTDRDTDVPIYGIYRVSCVPTGTLGSIGNATIDIVFNPKEGPNVGEFDWGSLLAPGDVDAGLGIPKKN